MVDPNSRLAREQETRDNGSRVRTWVPSQTLPSPTPQPGWEFRWIRTAILGQNDPTNVSAKSREGWVPVKAEDHPELKMEAGYAVASNGNVEIGGLLLCKAPKELMDQRTEYYRKQSEAQTIAVDNNYMRTEDKRMPLFRERKSTFGRGGK
jgi:hypothetical protein